MNENLCYPHEALMHFAEADCARLRTRLNGRRRKIIKTMHFVHEIPYPMCDTEATKRIWKEMQEHLMIKVEEIASHFNCDVVCENVYFTAPDLSCGIHATMSWTVDLSLYSK